MYDDIRRIRLAFFLKWFCYFMLLFICYVLQSTPRFLVILGDVKPVLLIALCVAVAMTELEFSGAIFAVFAGIMWEVSAGVLVGGFSLPLMIMCFLVGVFVKVYFRNNYFNLMVATLVITLILLSFYFLFSYVIYGYKAFAEYYFGFLVPTCIYTAAVSPVLLFLVKKVNTKFTTESR